MRRLFVGMAILSIALSSPLTYAAEKGAGTVNDKIAQKIIDTLNKHKAKGELKGADLELIVNNGEVLFKGRVATEKQMALAVSVAQDIDGVTRVVNDMQLSQSTTTEKKVAEVNPLEKLGGVANAMHSTTKAKAQEEKASVAKASSESNDTQIRDQVAHQLTQMQNAGTLKHFTINLSVDKGVVWLSGRVADQRQHELAIDVARHVRGVTQVVDNLKVVPFKQASAQTVSAPRPVQVQSPAAAPAPQLARQVRSNTPRPIGARYQPTPAPLPGTGAPTPMPIHHASFTGHGIRHDHAQMPSYAWPGYAAHPNYAALAYPRQHSPTAWPYIGPFYPYPQVPLGWRKVTLEWDDGFWMLNFSNRRRHARQRFFH